MSQSREETPKPPATAADADADHPEETQYQRLSKSLEDRYVAESQADGLETGEKGGKKRKRTAKKDEGRRSDKAMKKARGSRGVSEREAANQGDEDEEGKRKSAGSTTAKHWPSVAHTKKAKGADGAKKSARAIESRRKRSPKDAPHVPELELYKGESENGVEAKETTQNGTSRFIVFVGNLPYETTKASLESHFKSIRPDSIRHITQKSDPTTSSGSKRTGKRKDGDGNDFREKTEGRSKGYAFLEFSSFDRMRTCLQRYHHSWLAADASSYPPPPRDQQSNSREEKNKTRLPRNARQINVELTAGGGGTKSKARKEKLEKKNGRLNEQRVKDRRKRETEKAEKSKKASEETGQGEDPTKQSAGYADVHPSRLGRVKGK